jgi:uncharacterized protein with PIN domain
VEDFHQSSNNKKGAMLHPCRCHRRESPPKFRALIAAVLWWWAVLSNRWLLMGARVIVWSFPLVPNVSRRHEIQFRGSKAFLQNEDTDKAEEARRELMEMISKSDTAPLTTSKDSQRRQQQRGMSEDPLMGYSLQDLEAFAASREPQQSIKQSKNESPLSPSTPSPSLRDQDDVLFLEPDAYIQSRDRLNPDGSLLPETSSASASSFGIDVPWANDGTLDASAAATVDPRYREAMTNFLETVPNAPVAMELESTYLDQRFAGEITENQSMDELWKAIQQRGSSANPMEYYDASLSEALHQQVFANEEGFLNNSPAFLESLTDETKLDEALVERRGRAYRQRQEEAQAALEAQMDEFMAQLQQAQHDTSEEEQRQSRCGQCQALLADDEKQAPPMQSQVPEATTGLLCRVCYANVLIAKGKRAEQQEKLEREQRARNVMQSFRQTGEVTPPSPPFTAATASRPSLPNRRVYTSRPRPNPGTPIRMPASSSRPPHQSGNSVVPPTRPASGNSANGNDETRRQ